MRFPNFYESIEEAQIRLRNTVVLYDGEPFYVLAITDHVKDKTFRIFLSPLVTSEGKRPAFPATDNYHPGSDELGVYLDEYIKSHPTILRKEASSPYFNKFRPFPLGMCAHGSGVYFLERQPNRVTQQGLLRSMIFETKIDCGYISMTNKAVKTVDVFSQAFVDCIKGDYNNPGQCLDVLLDTENYDYEAAAFSRDFALVKGPCDMVFLGYKDEIVGLLPNNDFSRLKLSKEFSYCKEVIEELDLFQLII